MFGATQGMSGYYFANCHNVQVVDRIKEIYPILYGKTNLPKSKVIGKKFARWIIV
jgi:hypothetical protein